MNDVRRFDSFLRTRDGRDLSLDEVRKLEQKLSDDPQDFDSRLLLLGHYLGLHADVQPKFAEHALWIIENKPEDGICNSSIITQIPRFHDEGFSSRAEDIWRNHVQRQPDNLLVLKHAAKFFGMHSELSHLTKQFLEMGKRLDPANHHWSAELGRFYRARAEEEKSSDNSRTQLLKLSCDELQNAYAVSSDHGKYSILAELSESAIELKDFAKATEYGSELLQRADNEKGTTGYGIALYNGHSNLGLVNLLQGNIEDAKRHLLEAGDSTRFIEADTFIPDLRLAQSLLKHNDYQTVLSFLETIKETWQSEQLDSWIRQLKDGRIPKLGSRLPQ